MEHTVRALHDELCIIKRRVFRSNTAVFYSLQRCIVIGVERDDGIIIVKNVSLTFKSDTHMLEIIHKKYGCALFVIG